MIWAAIDRPISHESTYEYQLEHFGALPRTSPVACGVAVAERA